AHQQPDDAHRFGAAEADQLVAAAGARAVIQLVVLGAPGGELTLDPDLALEDAVDAAVKGPARGPAAAGVHELVRLVAEGLPEELQEAHHGVVVEGDVP